MINLSEQEAFTACASLKWSQLVSGIYPSIDALIDKAKVAWWKEVGVTEWLAAFSAHPRIGDKVEGKPPAFAAFSQSEQAAAAQSATQDVAAELQHWNRLYYDKFGIIFIICAKGRSSQEILATLKSR